MAKTEATRLNANARETTGSRSMRRLRREGRVPGVLYGGTGDPVPFDVDARELRHALQGAGAVLELAIGSDTDTAVVKDTQRHPVRGETMHLDLVRVRMDVAIQATAILELEGVEEAPGIVEGGVLEQVTREVTVEALPGDIPESIKHDASGLEIAATLTLGEISAPPNVKIVDDPETVVATVVIPRLVVETEDEIETETEVVGEGEEGAAEAAGADEATADEGADAAASDADTTSE
jgi:large subunit ribosomal protein L25